MKDFKHWGAKKRVFPAYNYNALWFNLKTIRLGSGVAKELPADMAEFYDVGINTLCNAECPFCYVSASQKGINYPNICETWEKWMDTYQSKVKNGTVFTNKHFNCYWFYWRATIHPDFCKFLETVYNTGVVPNYTTNGITLSSIKTSRELLEYTRNLLVEWLVSLGNKALKRNADMAIVNLITMGDTNVNIHHIISTKDSVDDFIKEWKRYGSDIKYHVLLPLMPSGRSSKGLDEGVFEYLEEKILEENVTNVAFGAHFCKYLKNSKIPTYLYPPESLSKNVILTKDKVQITPSSFNLNPIKIIEL